MVTTANYRNTPISLLDAEQAEQMNGIFAMLRDMGRMQFKTYSVSLGKSPEAQQERIDIPVWHDSESKAAVTGLTGNGLLIEAISPEGDTRFFYMWLDVPERDCDAACQKLGLPAPTVTAGVGGG